MLYCSDLLPMSNIVKLNHVNATNVVFDATNRNAVHLYAIVDCSKILNRIIGKLFYY